MKSIFSAATVLQLISNVKGHSWLACADYPATINGQDYDDSNCIGYPRDWNTYATTTFGEDRGFNYQLSGTTGSQQWCVTSRDGDSDYTTAYPQATYTVGNTIRMLWPAKNHANYECFNNIPDTAMKIYAMKESNYAETTDISSWTTVKDWHEDGTGGQDGTPFQNCPEFCDDTDKAVCYGDMVLNSSLFNEDTTYVFMWYWEFNTGQVYTTCWDAVVDTNGQATGPITPSPVTIVNTPAPVSPTRSPNTPTPTQVGDTPQPTPAPVVSAGDTPTPTHSPATEYYIVIIPICYEGANYDKSTLIDAAESLFDHTTFTVIAADGSVDDWNVTLYTETHEVSDVSNSVNFWIWGREDNDMCEAIEAAFGEGECSVCDDYIVYDDETYAAEYGAAVEDETGFDTPAPSAPEDETGFDTPTPSAPDETGFDSPASVVSVNCMMQFLIIGVIVMLF